MRHRFREESTTPTEGRANDSGPDVDAISPPASTIKQRGTNSPVSGLQRDLVGGRPVRLRAPGEEPRRAHSLPRVLDRHRTVVQDLPHSPPFVTATPLVLEPWTRPNGSVLRVILDLRRTTGRIRLLRCWSSLVGSRCRCTYPCFAAVSHDQARSWAAMRPETWVGSGWRGWRRVPVVHASDYAVRAAALFALHPPPAVLGFEASIDGLLW